MSKHTHHQSKEEQIFSKAQGTVPLHYEEKPLKIAVEDSSIQLRAYQIHLEKGGSDLDNWLEAEITLRNSK